MKNSIKTIFENSIRDNRLYIEQYGGNIAEYYREDFAYQDQGHVWYLTDEEIELWETMKDERERLINEIHDFLDDYDKYVWEFLDNNSSRDRLFEFVEEAKENNNYIEIEPIIVSDFVEDNGELSFDGLQNIKNANNLDSSLVDFARIECFQGEQQDDADTIRELALNFTEKTIVVRVALENDDFNQEQSVYYFLH